MGVLRCALLGTGGIANEFLAPALALTAGVRLWSVLSRSKSNAEAFASRHGALSPTPAYDDLDALLSDPSLDAVIVATPDRLHAAQCIAAARAGKHVFCEKPLATSADEARAIVAACEEARVTLGVAYHLRHHAGHRALVGEVRKGAIGRVRHARVQWTFAAPDATNWRASADVGRWWALASVGTHGLDLLRWVMVEAAGEVVEMKSLSSSPKFGVARDESTILTMKFADGSTAELFASVLFRAPRRVELFGDGGYAEATGTLGPWGKGEIRINDTLLEYTPTNPYVGELEDFAAAVRERRSPAVDGREALRNVELLERALPL
ncbi:MAG: Gfo/Idh/MocA family oxidoreductase [Myxococcales bacterium]|nr:Gfo/Idh/MocA family oxidoreductase [Myxococcales bacterium]